MRESACTDGDLSHKLCISKMVLKWCLVNISNLADESSLCNDWRALVPILTELILNAISEIKQLVRLSSVNS